MSGERVLLVPHDFGEPADAALRMALGIAPKLDATIVVLHVYEPPSAGYARAAVPVSDVARALADASRAAVEVIVAGVRPEWERTRGIVREGRPWRAIVDAAEELGAEMIIMGTAGRSGIERALLGSVAEKVVRTAHVPVLTVHASDVERPKAEASGRPVVAGRPPAAPHRG